MRSDGESERASSGHDLLGGMEISDPWSPSLTPPVPSALAQPVVATAARRRTGAPGSADMLGSLRPDLHSAPQAGPPPGDMSPAADSAPTPIPADVSQPGPGAD